MQNWLTNDCLVKPEIQHADANFQEERNTLNSISTCYLTAKTLTPSPLLFFEEGALVAIREGN